MWLVILSIILIIVGIIILVIYLRNSDDSNTSVTTPSPSSCGSQYVDAQQNCLRGNPLAGCDKKRFVSNRQYDAWATEAQKCIDNVQNECTKNCRSQDCPPCLSTRSRF